MNKLSKLLLLLVFLGLVACDSAPVEAPVTPQAAEGITIEGISIISDEANPVLGLEMGDAVLGYNPIPELTTINLDGFRNQLLKLQVKFSEDSNTSLIRSVGMSVNDRSTTKTMPGEGGKAFENYASYDFMWKPLVNASEPITTPQKLTVTAYSERDGAGDELATYTLRVRVFPSSDSLRNDKFGPLANPPLPADYETIEPGQSIQNVLNTKRDAKVFVLKEGIYYGQMIVLREGVELIGENDKVVLDGRLSENSAEQREWGIRGANNAVVRNLEIRNYGVEDQGFEDEGGPDQKQLPRSRPAVDTYEDNGMVVEFNHIHSNYTMNVNIAANSDTVIRKNKLGNAGRYGINGTRSVRGVVENNEIYGNNVRNWDPGNDAGGSKFVKAKQLRVRNNYVHNNLGTGLWVDIENDKVVLSGNLSIDNAPPGTEEFKDKRANGIFYEISENAEIFGNTVRGNLGDGILVSESRNIKVEDNLLWGNNTGIRLKSACRGDTINYLDNIEVTKNVVVGGSNQENTQRNKFAAIFVYGQGDCQYWNSDITPTSIRNTFTFTDNIYARGNGTGFEPITQGYFYNNDGNDSAIKTLEQWQQSVGETQ